MMLLNRFESIPRVWLRVLVSALIFVAAAGLYLSTATPGLIVGGGAESESAQLQRAAYRLGIAHSTGYPLYTIIGYFTGQLADLFNQNPYTWITYTSSIAGAVALALFFQLALLFRNPPAALAATGLLAVTNTFWHINTIAETQALHALSVIGIFWLSLVHLRRPDAFLPLAGIALLSGIGLANHRTIVVSMMPAALAVLLTGAWLKWRIRQWALLIALVILPVLSYGYIFWRGTDPFVVMGIRPTWEHSYLANLPDDFLFDYIMGAGLNYNIAYPTHDFMERLDFVVNTLRDQITTPGMVAGLVGLALLAIKRNRDGVILFAYTAGWTFFLMSWRLDWKATIYYHALVVPFLVGIVYLATWPVEMLRRQKRINVSPAVAAALFSLPVFALCFATYARNLPNEDRSKDTNGAAYLAQMATLPQGALVYTGAWATDTFILIEYMDISGRNDIRFPTEYTFQELVNLVNTSGRPVFISPFMRAQWGLYGERFALPELGLALSGTHTQIFLQARPKHDPTLQAEADATEFQPRAAITPEIILYSYTLERSPEGLKLGVYWQATEPTSQRYSTYTHLRYYGSMCHWDDSVRLLSQHDSRDPIEGNYPTLYWQAGEIVKDTYLIPWPDAPLPHDGVALTVGMTLNGERQQEFCLPLPSG